MTISLDNNVRIVSKDEIFFKEGEEASKIILVKSGEVICLKRSKERLIPVFTAGPQQILGEDAVFSKAPYSYSAIAREGSEVVEISASLVNSVMGEAPYWLSALMATLGERLGGTSQAIAEHRIISAELSGAVEFSPQEENRLKKLLG